MLNLDGLISKLKAFPEEIDVIVEQVAFDNADVLVEMNTDDQLFNAGVNKNGVRIASYSPYTDITKGIKRAQGQPIDRVTLLDTGDFHNSFTISFLGDGFEIKATDSKTEELTMKYGTEIFGLTDENVAIFAQDYIKPRLVEAMRELL